MHFVYRYLPPSSNRSTRMNTEQYLVMFQSWAEDIGALKDGWIGGNLRICKQNIKTYLPHENPIKILAKYYTQHFTPRSHES